MSGSHHNGHATDILVVEDDVKISQILADYLRHEGFSPSCVHDGLTALQQVQQQVPALLVLDLMLPGMDGLSLCRAIRKFSDVPILMLTARVDEIDRLLGLDGGADDYVCKPFSPREVMARVRALMRRSQGRVTTTAQIAPWAIDDNGQRVSWNGQTLDLTPVEFRLLRLLLGRPGRVFSRNEMLDAVHSDLRDVSDRAIDSHVKNIRRKLVAVDASFDAIASVYGVGYRFDAPV